jgi:hypothetical protein
LFVCVCIYVCSELFQYSARARVKNGLSFACACLKFFSLSAASFSLSPPRMQKSRACQKSSFLFFGIFGSKIGSLSRVKLIFFFFFFFSFQVPRENFSNHMRALLSFSFFFFTSSRAR